MEIVTLREFARRIEVSLTAIQKGIQSGRITAQKDAAGKTTGIDWDSQSVAWEANCKSPQRRAKNQAGGRPRNDGKPVAAPKTGPKPREGDVVTSLEPQPTGGALKRSQTTPAPAGQMSMAEVQRARELVKLQIDNLKLKEAQGELVQRAEMEKLGFQLAQGVVSALYNIPERCSDELAGMTDPHKIHEMLTKEIDQAVQAIRSRFNA